MIANDQDEGDAVLTEIRAHTAIIRLNRSAERNSLSKGTLRKLEEAFNLISSQSEVRVIVFTGTGDVFASGADIRELSALDAEAANGFALLGQRLFQKISEASQMTTAAINGYCMGGGLDLALACRFRVAATAAIFAHPGARLGIITGWGGTQRLPRLIGQTRALEILLTGRRVNSSEALEIGLVNRIGDPVLDLAFEFAEKLRNDVKDW